MRIFFQFKHVINFGVTNSKSWSHVGGYSLNKHLVGFNYFSIIVVFLIVKPTRLSQLKKAKLNAIEFDKS